MTLALFDQTLDMGADGNTLIVDSSQPHGFRFGPPAASAGGALTLIQKLVLASDVASAVMTSIPNNYTNLLLIAQGQDSSTTAAYLDWRLKINNDAVAANYIASQYVQGQGGAAAAGTQAPTTAGAICGIMPGQLNGGGLGCSVIYLIGSGIAHQWNTQVIEESYVVHSGATATTIRLSRGFHYKGASVPVTGLTFTCGGVKFLTGTLFALYGMQ